MRLVRAGLYCQCVLGLKPQAQSYSPFGTRQTGCICLRYQDENEAPFEHLHPATQAQYRQGTSNWVDTPFLQATTLEDEDEDEDEHEHEDERETPGEGAGIIRATSYQSILRSAKTCFGLGR